MSNVISKCISKLFLIQKYAPYGTAGRLLEEAKFVRQRWNALSLMVTWRQMRMNVKNLSG